MRVKMPKPGLTKMVSQWNFFLPNFSLNPDGNIGSHTLFSDLPFIPILSESFRFFPEKWPHSDFPILLH